MTYHNQQAHLTQAAASRLWQMRDLIAEWRESAGPCCRDLLREYSEANRHRRTAERESAALFRAYLAGRGLWPELHANALPIPAEATAP